MIFLIFDMHFEMMKNSGFNMVTSANNVEKMKLKLDFSLYYISV